MQLGDFILLAYAPEPPAFWLLPGATQVHNGPKWIVDGYTINARVSDRDGGAWRHQSNQHELLRAALRNVLRDRFKLVLHEQPTEVNGYALVTKKSKKSLLKEVPPGFILPKGDPLDGG
jgi:uncharacterized protein (TIGR03435 family)